MNAPIIDTVKAVQTAHKAFALVESLPADKQERLYNIAKAAFSATMVYVVQPKAPVQVKHYEAVEALYKEMDDANAS